MGKKDSPNISRAEWMVMKVLWDAAPLSAAEVVEALEGQVDWSPLTVRTLINRLSQKGLLSRSKRAGCYRYTPKQSEMQCIRKESVSFAERFFDGRWASMLAYFVEEAELSAEDREELRRLLDSDLQGE